MKKNSIFTVGYEGATVEALIKTLLAHGITMMIDVRAVLFHESRAFLKTNLQPD